MYTFNLFHSDGLAHRYRYNKYGNVHFCILMVAGRNFYKMYISVPGDYCFLDKEYLGLQRLQVQNANSLIPMFCFIMAIKRIRWHYVYVYLDIHSVAMGEYPIPFAKI